MTSMTERNLLLQRSVKVDSENNPRLSDVHEKISTVEVADEFLSLKPTSQLTK